MNRASLRAGSQGELESGWQRNHTPLMVIPENTQDGLEEQMAE
jgi:hypothetical protein